MNFQDWIEQIKLELDEVKTEADLMAFLKRTELTMIKSQILTELANDPFKFVEQIKKEVGFEDEPQP